MRKCFMECTRVGPKWLWRRQWPPWIPKSCWSKSFAALSPRIHRLHLPALQRTPGCTSWSFRVHTTISIDAQRRSGTACPWKWPSGPWTNLESIETRLRFEYGPKQPHKPREISKFFLRTSEMIRSNSGVSKIARSRFCIIFTHRDCSLFCHCFSITVGINTGFRLIFTRNLEKIYRTRRSYKCKQIELSQRPR